jgi:carbamoyl-phosphate synthase large subunit
MKDLCVLVTAAGNVFMPGTLACLKKNGERSIRVVGADMSDDGTILQMCDAAYQVPRCADPSYVDMLLDICRKERVDVLLPIMSAELNALSERKDEFTAVGTAVSVSSPEALAVANNKRKLFDFMEEQGIPCGEYEAVRSCRELEESAKRLGYPKKRVCVKATDGSGSRGFRILAEDAPRFEMFLHEKPSAGITTLRELLDVLSEAEVFPELLVMEYLPGAEYTVDLLADRGKVLVSCCRKSLRMENSIMLEGVVEDAPAVTGLCGMICERLGLDGNIGFDVRERADGTPVIMECNPRITAGIPFFALAGVNLPYLCVKKLLGEELPQITPEYGKIVRRRWMEMTV